MKKKLLILIAVTGVVFVLRNSPLAFYLSFDNLVESREFLIGYVSQNYFLSIIMFICIYFVVTVFSLPGAAILTLAAGALYGSWQGALIVNVGATAGATGAFLAARYLMGKTLQEKYKKQLNKFNKEFEENGINYMFSLRLIPAFPFFLINIMAGLTSISIKRFIWTTSLGIIPGSFVYSNAGNQLSKVSSVKEIFSFEILTAFILLGLLSLVPVFVKKIKKERA